jgi:galacturan 1,4-alpha-galacturonidase
VKLSNINFTGIKGSSATPEAVVLKCSKGYPCQNVCLKDVQLKNVNGSDAIAVCANVNPQFSGTVLPKTCTAPTTTASS